ncbi:MAG: DUF2130 domain-containing protein [Candidatus Nitrosopumilus sp. bin_68KS]
MITNLKESKCPLCRQDLASEEYDAALVELQNKVEESYKLQQETFENQHNSKLEQLHAQHEELLESQKKSHEAEISRLESDISDTYKKQLTFMEKNYESMTKQSQKQFADLQKQLESGHKKDLVEKEKQIKLIKKEQDTFRKSVINATKAEFDLKSGYLHEELREREIQISRFKDEVDGLKKQLTQSQAELKGEAGELDLFVTLTDAFPQDNFRRQKRGISSGDLIQRIRSGSSVLDTPIVYDNKNANTITKADVTKAKKYQKMHGTSYVLIVGNNLPKTSVPNGLLGEKDGIILVHPSIVVEVSKRIRDGMIEISKLSLGKEDRQEKQDKLYSYIMSQEFALILKTLSDLNEKLFHLQSKEEKDHQTLWKNRKSLQEELLKAYNELSSGIESITLDSIVELAPDTGGK